MHSALPSSDIPEYQYHLPRADGGRVSCVSSRSNSVVRLDRSQERRVPDGAQLLDAFLDGFEARPDIAEHLPQARRELGSSFAQNGAPITLRTLRLQKGLSQSQLAKALGTSQAAVSEYESRRRKPHEDQIRGLASALMVDFNTLMEALANG